MSDLDFEKQVRQKLNDLKLTPSAEAWVNIENKLRAHNNRRTPFLWLSLMLTGMLAGGFILLFRDAGQSIKKEAVAIEVTSATQKTFSGSTSTEVPLVDTILKAVSVEREQSISTKVPLADTILEVASVEREQSTSTQVPLAEDAFIKSPSTLSIPEKGQSPIIVKVNPAKKAASTKAPLPHAASTKRLNIQDRTITIPSLSGLSPIKLKNALKSNLWQGLENGEQETSSNKELVLPDTQLNEAAGAVSPVKSKPSVFDAKVFKSLKADKDPLIASVAKPASKQVRLNKWSFAGNGFAGISAVNEGGLINAEQPNVEDVSYTANFAPLRATLPIALKPSYISPGISFSVGASARRELSKRLSVSAGLNYSQFNTRSRVGDRVNSSQVVNNGVSGYLYVQSYYLLDPVQNTEYKNKYHFIELPVMLHTRIGSGNKIPIYWNAGLILSRLISSTSLHFDGTTGVYYKNDRLLNQTQVGAGTGFSFVLFNATSHPLWIGPSVRSNISTILKKEVSASKHFVSLGLNANYFFKR